MITAYENLQLSTLFMSVLCLVAQSHPAPCDPMDCSPPGSSVHGNSPSKNTGVGAMPSSRGSSPLTDRTYHCRWILYHLRHQGRLFRIPVSGILNIHVWNILNTLLFGRLYCCSQFLTFYLCPNFFCNWLAILPIEVIESILDAISVGCGQMTYFGQWNISGCDMNKVRTCTHGIWLPSSIFVSTTRSACFL